jgi:hypothetical protein
MEGETYPTHVSVWNQRFAVRGILLKNVAASPLLVGVQQSPERKIIHIDMDCCYSAIEDMDNPALRKARGVCWVDLFPSTSARAFNDFANKEIPLGR